MDILILGTSLTHLSYRGTDRTWPYYVEPLPESHPANQAFLWFVSGEDSHELGLVHDLAKARALIEEYRRLDPPQEFELIEMTRGEAQPESGGKLLGYDVTELYCHSILASGLCFDAQRHQRAMSADESYRSIAPLVRLFDEHFSAQLNEHVLFSDKAVAEFCCECAATLIQFDNDLFDMPRESRRVAGLYDVPTH